LEIALFLGAGASSSFGMPDTKKFNELLHKRLRTDSGIYWFATFYEYEDVEKLLQAIRDIKHFWEGYGGKYFRHHSRNLIFKESNRADKNFKDFVNEIEQLEKIIHDEVFKAYNWDRKYDDSLNKIYSKLVNFLSDNSDEIKIFTTNYDAAIERFCSKSDNFYFIDGFNLDDSTKRFFWGNNFKHDKYNIHKPIFLYKLHGSLNWKERADDNIEIERTTVEGPSTDKNFTDNIIIFPTLSTKDRHMLQPFNELKNQFNDPWSLYRNIGL